MLCAFRCEIPLLVLNVGVCVCECVAVVVVVFVVVVVVPSTSSSGRGPRSYILDAQDGSGLRKMNSGEVAAGIAGGMTPAITNGPQ